MRRLGTSEDTCRLAITGGDGSCVGDDGERRRSNVQRRDGRRGKIGDRREGEKEKERGRW